MRCLYCGERLPLLRKWKSAEYCSQGHQALHLKEQQEIGLRRLLGEASAELGRSHLPAYQEHAEAIARASRMVSGAVAGPPQCGYKPWPLTSVPGAVFRSLSPPAAWRAEKLRMPWVEWPRVSHRLRTASQPLFSLDATGGSFPMRKEVAPQFSVRFGGPVRHCSDGLAVRAVPALGRPLEAGAFRPWQGLLRFRAELTGFDYRSLRNQTRRLRPWNGLCARGASLRPDAHAHAYPMAHGVSIQRPSDGWFAAGPPMPQASWRPWPDPAPRCPAEAQSFRPARLAPPPVGQGDQTPGRLRTGKGGVSLAEMPLTPAGCALGQPGFLPSTSARSFQAPRLAPRSPAGRLDPAEVSAPVALRRRSWTYPQVAPSAWPARLQWDVPDLQTAIPFPGGVGLRPMAAATTASAPFRPEVAIRAAPPCPPRAVQLPAEARVSDVAVADLQPLEPLQSGPRGQPRAVEAVTDLPAKPPQTTHECLEADSPAEPRLLTRRLAYADAMPESRAGERRPATLGKACGLGCTVRTPRLRSALIDLVRLDDPDLLRKQLRKPWLLRAQAAWDQIPSAARMGAAAASLAAVVLAALSFLPQHMQASWPSTFALARKNIVRRAAIALTDDFRTGLSAWEGAAGWQDGWSYDDAGFARVGPLAIYRPSLSLTDYRMEFFGQIEKRGLGWVIRARDLNNYYAMRLIHTGQGPVPAVLLQRYAVIDGKAGPVVERKVNQPLQRDTLYQVQVNVTGSEFSLTIQGKIVDSWSESRLSSGGVGFFTGKGEQARLRWVGVWHQYDALGRLCALLAVHGR